MPDTTDITDANIEALQQQYKDDLKKIEGETAAKQQEFKQRGDELSDDAQEPFKFDLTVKWTTKTFRLHLPQVAMKDREVSLDLPQAEMKRQEWIFHTPSIRMKRVKIGEYPEFHGFTVRWSPIWADVPEPFMQEQRVVLDVPEFKMGRTSFVIGVPEFSWRETQFKIDIPEITVHDISIVIPLETEDMQRKASELKADAERYAGDAKAAYQQTTRDFQNRLGSAITENITQRFTTARADLIAKRDHIVAEFEKHLTTIRMIKGTPAAAENPELMAQMQKNEADILANQAKAVSDIDGALASLQTQLETAIQKAMESEGLKIQAEVPGPQAALHQIRIAMQRNER